MSNELALFSAVGFFVGVLVASVLAWLDLRRYRRFAREIEAALAEVRPNPFRQGTESGVAYQDATLAVVTVGIELALGRLGRPIKEEEESR